MRILLTGSTGFIGNHVITNLLNRYPNCEIIATGTNLEKAKKFEWFSKVKFIEYQIDLNFNQNLFKFFNQPDILIHLAWCDLPNYKSLNHIEKNLMPHYFFLKNLIENGLKNINVIGTCLEYGLQEGKLNEAMSCFPHVPYAIAKNTLRIFLETLLSSYRFNLKWIRLFYMYGQGQSSKSLLSQLDQALNKDESIFNMSGGEQLRDYLPISQVAEYIPKISLQQEINGIINCCSGNPISVRKFVEDYLKLQNKTIELNLGYYPYPDYEPMAFWGDNTKLQSILNHKIY